MKKQVVFIIITISCIKLYSQDLKKDSLNYGLKNKLFYIQGDLALPIFALISNRYWERQSQLYNVCVGYTFQNSVSKKIKKSIQLTEYYYDETIYSNSFYNYPTHDILIERKDFFVIPEMKFLFNKKKYNKGFYSSIGLGGGEHNHFEDHQLIVRQYAWSSLAAIGFIIPIKRFFFDIKLGYGAYFVYQAKYYNVDFGSQTPQQYVDNIQKYDIDPNVKKIEVVNGSTVKYNYKYFGVMKAEFIPDFGIHFGITF